MARAARFLVRARSGRLLFPDAQLSPEEYRRQAARATPDLGGVIYEARNYRVLQSSSPVFVLEASDAGLEAKRTSGRGQAAALGLMVAGLVVGLGLFLFVLGLEGGARGSTPVAFASLLLMFACGSAGALPGRRLLAALPRDPGWRVQVVTASYGSLVHTLELRSDVGAVTVRVVARRAPLGAALRRAGQIPPTAETFHEGFRA